MKNVRHRSPTVLVFCGIGLLLLSSAAFPGVISGPILNPATNHSYYLIDSQPWNDAQAEAILLGGNLVTVNDALEHEWIVDTFSFYGGITRSLWIGFNDALIEGQFEWVSGELSPFENWKDGEPNNGRGVEDYAYIIAPGSPAAGKWNDAEGIVLLYGVVETTRAVSSPAPLSFILFFGLISLWRSKRGRRA